MQTTAGWSGLIGSIVPRDAHVVALLRDAVISLSSLS